MPLDFKLTPEQEEVRKLAHEFAEKEMRPNAAYYDKTEEFPYDVVNKAHQVGLTPAAFIPEQYGGHGFDYITGLVVDEELHWGCAGLAVCINSPGLAIAGIRAMGSEEQKKRWLPEFCQPDKVVLGGLGLTEPDSGSDALAMKTIAKRVKDGYGPGALGALATLEATRPGVGAGALGIARAAYEFALDYATPRWQFGKPI